jgi:quinol monooxygenase YgiN
VTGAVFKTVCAAVILSWVGSTPMSLRQSLERHRGLSGCGLGMSQSVRSPRRSDLSAIVIVDLPATEQTRDELVALLEEALHDTRAFDGNRGASLCTEHEEPTMVTIVEHWESLEHYLAYDAWRVETGFMEQLEPMLGGEPGERHLDLLAS